MDAEEEHPSAEHEEESLGAVPRKKFLERIPVVSPAYLLYRGYGRRNGPLLAAGLAYYALFAAGPLVLVTLQLAGLFVGETTAQQEMAQGMEQYLGPLLADALSKVLVQMRAGSASSTFVIIGGAFLIWAGIRLFVRLQVSFNIMWDVRVRSHEFSLRRLLSRLLSFLFILVPAVLYLGSLFLSASLTWLQDLLNAPGILLGIAQAVIPLLITWVALLLIYVVLPDIKLSWRDCWLGSLCAAAGCAVGSWAFGTYLVWSGNQKYAGAVGALIALIVWADFIAIITLLGVRLNRALYLWRGKVIQPYDYAALITDLPDDAPAEDSAC